MFWKCKKKDLGRNVEISETIDSIYGMMNTLFTEHGVMPSLFLQQDLKTFIRMRETEIKTNEVKKVYIDEIGW